MEQTSHARKVAILVDGDSCISHSLSGRLDGLTTVQSIKSASLRCLMRLANQSTGTKNVQWAYFVFSQNRSGLLQRSIGRKFKELSLNTFQEFEECLQNINDEQVKKNHEEEYLNSTAKQIRLAITDAVMNLPWLPADITSPVKFKRRSSSYVKEPETEVVKNHILLLTFCPHNFKDLKTFVSHDNKNVISENDRLEQVFEDIIPTKLQQNLQFSCRAQFHLADLTSLFHVGTMKDILSGDGRAHTLIKRGIERMGGKLFQISSILSHGKMACFIPSLINKERHSSNRICQGTFPVLRAFAAIQGVSEENGCDEENRAMLIFSGKSCNNVFELSVLLEPVTSPTLVTQLITGNIRCTSDAAEVASFEIEDTANFTKLKCWIEIDSSKKSSFNGKTNLHLVVIGTACLVDTRHCLLEFCTKAFFLTPSAVENSECFGYIMQNSVEKQVVHVVEVGTCDGGMSLGILQPLTVTSAALFIFGPGMPQFAIYRLMLAAKSGEVLAKQKECLDEFIEKSVHPICFENMERSQQRATDNFVQMFLLATKDKSIEEVAEKHQFSAGEFTSSFLEEYYPPGAEPLNTQSVLAELNSEDDPDKAVRNFELKLLRKLQKKYISEKSARLTDTPKVQKAKTPRRSASRSGMTKLRRSPRKKCSAATDKDAVPVVLPPRHPVRKSRSHTAPSRTDQLWQAYRTSLKRSDSTKNRNQDGDTGKPKLSATDSIKTLSENFGDMENEQELLEFVKKFYEDVLSNEMNVLSASQRLVNTCVHFFKSRNAESPEKKCCEFFAQILLDNTAIKQKYQQTGQEHLLFREYELQVVFLMELETLMNCEASEEETEAKVSKIAGLLRAMSFMRDPEFCGKYVKNVLLQNYVDTAPVFLTKIYDELLLPLPPQLESLLSPDELMSVATRSVNPLMSVGSNASSANNSVHPPSNHGLRDRKMNRYRSFHAVPTRQISVPKPAGAKKETKKRASEQPRRVSARIASSVKKSAKKRIQSKEDGSTKVRKNLFGGDGDSKKPKLERRQSCMGDIQKHSRKHSRTPKEHHVLKNRRVAETPAHKQKKQTVWRRHEKERRRTHTADNVQVIAESPGKQLLDDAAKRTPKKAHGKLMKSKSFYSENVIRTEKLEARMINQKILSPTWNAPKFGKLLQKTPPRRIQPRMLFQSLLQSPSPQKSFAENLPESPVNRKEPFSLGKAVNALNFFQSPSKSTRSQQASLKAFSCVSEGKFSRLFPSQEHETMQNSQSFTGMTEERFQRVFTPHRNQVMKTPVKNSRAEIDSKTTPAKTIRLSEIACESPGASRRVSFSTQLFSPQKGIRQPCDPFQSPSKSILTPKKAVRTPSRISLQNQLGSPMKAMITLQTKENQEATFQSPRKRIRTPMKSEQNQPFIVPGSSIQQSAPVRCSPRRVALISSRIGDHNTNKSPITPVIGITSGLDSSSSDTSAQPSPRLTRSTTKSRPTNSTDSENVDTKARANLSSLFDSKSEPEINENLSLEKDSEQMNIEDPFVSESKENDTSFDNNSDSQCVSRRTLRSRSRSMTGFKAKSPSKRLFSVPSSFSSSANTTSVNRIQTRGVKRKETDTENDAGPRKKSCSRFSTASILSQSIPDVSLTDHNEVFLDESCVEKTRTLEGITKSSLISDSSNSAFSFSDIAEIEGASSTTVTNIVTSATVRSKSETFSTIPQIDRLKKFEFSYDSESSRSPEFSDKIRPKPERLMSIGDSECSQPSSPVIQITRTESPLTVDDTCTRVPHASAVSAADTRPPSRSSNASVTPGRATRANSLSTIGQIPTFSPTAHLQSPTSANRYSPLSTKGLVQLTESPILAGSNSVKCTPTRNQQNEHNVLEESGMDAPETKGELESDMSPVQKRPARRVLYRAQTKANL